MGSQGMRSAARILGKKRVASDGVWFAWFKGFGHTRIVP